MVPAQISQFSGVSYSERVKRKIRQNELLIRPIRLVRSSVLLGPLSGFTLSILKRFRRNPEMDRTPTIFDPIEVAGTVAELDAKGLVTGLRLPKDYIEPILEYSKKGKDIPNPHWDSPEIYRIVHDQAIVDVIAAYLGAEPAVSKVDLFWSLPNQTGKVSYAERFHFDVPDFKSVTACFYLTDVDEECGPHVVIESTHRKRTFSQFLNPYLSDDEAAAKYGQRVKTLTGEAGTGFLEDLVIYHKRQAVRQRRLALMTVYTTVRTPDFEARPAPAGTPLSLTLSRSGY